MTTILEPKCIVIASSTGGPNTLEKIFTGLPSVFDVPVLLVQHIPIGFDQSLASSLTSRTGVPFIIPRQGQKLDKLGIYLAPSNRHMELEVREDEEVYIALRASPHRLSVRPCANFLFESAASIYGSQCLGIVLTGMGEDGADGSQVIFDQGGRVIIQDEASSCVWGMPKMVQVRGCFNEIMSDVQIKSRLQAIFKSVKNMEVLNGQ